MKLSEIKLRVDHRLRPLLLPGVRVKYGKGQFAIVSYEYMDSNDTWYIYHSNSSDPLEYKGEQIATFINGLSRTDRQPIPRFYDEDPYPVIARNEATSRPRFTGNPTLKNTLEKALKKTITEATSENEILAETVINEYLAHDADLAETAPEHRPERAPSLSPGHRPGNAGNTGNALALETPFRDGVEPEHRPERAPSLSPGHRPGISGNALVETPSRAFVHIESPIKIYVTKDYNLFTLLPGNRTLNKTKIKKIKEDIAAGTNLLKECPIIVVEHKGKLMVMDGQHRLQVCKELDSYVWYIVRTSLSLLEIAKMNSNTEKWNQKDFLNCYVATGNPNYKIIHEFMAAHGYPLGFCLMLLSKGIDTTFNNTDLYEQFKTGIFKVEKLEEANNIASQINLFKAFDRYQSREFGIAILRIIKANLVPLQELHTAFKEHPEMLTYRGSAKEYILCLETIINVNRKKRVLLVD